MNNEKIELYKVRDFSDRINVTFEFIKQNGKQISRNFMYLIPIYIICAIVTSYFQGGVYSNSFYGYGYDSYDLFSSPAYLLSLLASLATGITSFVALLFVISFVAEYEESEDGVVDDSKVWGRAKSSFLGSLGGSILIGIAVAIGLVFCCIPGIWALVSFSLFVTVYIVERNKMMSRGIIDCIGESYSLIKQDWFGSFGYLFVMGIIAMAFYFVLSIPTMMGGMMMALFPDGFIINVVIMTIASSLYYVGSLFISAITSVATSLLYFDLKERQDGLSLQRKIDNIGQEPEL